MLIFERVAGGLHVLQVLRQSVDLASRRFDDLT